MASGESSGRAAASDYSSFDFGADDVLCPYGDYAAQDPSIRKRSDLPGTDIQGCRMGRSLVSAYEKEDCSKSSVTSSVEKCMKKYADTLLRSLEAISGRLSQLEIHFHKLEQSLCELRGDFIQDQSDKDLNFKSLEKHLQEVHRSVQIMRDKQELAETHKELAKLQMVQKESVEKKEEVVARSVSEPKKLDDKPDVANQQLALALPRPATSPPILPAGTSQSIQPYKELPMQHQPPISYNIQLDQIIMSHAARYYHHHHQTLPQSQPVQARPQLQDGPVQAPRRQPLIGNQNRPPSFSQYQQQLPSQPAQHLAQQVAQPQQPASQTQPSYPPYPPQPVPGTFPDSSVPTQVPQPNVTAIRPEVLPFGDGRTGSLGSQPPLHNMQQSMLSPVSQSSFGSQLSKGSYMGGSTTHPPPPYNLQGYNAASSYPPNNNLPVARNQQIPPSNSAALPYDSRLTRNHSYGEMIEKAVGMGYDRNQIIGVVQRMVESGQPMDFNSLLDRLNGQAAAAPARAW